VHPKHGHAAQLTKELMAEACVGFAEPTHCHPAFFFFWVTGKMSTAKGMVPAFGRSFANLHRLAHRLQR